VGDPVTLTATATDPEDGNLGSSISWTSTIDGPIGSGATLNVTSLAAGNHTITASATDSALASDSDAIAITIGGAGSNGPYLQAQDGTVSMQAEHFDTNVSSGGATWSLITPAGASNGEAMLAGTGGRLEFRVNFSQTGSHDVYLRSYGPNGKSNSAFAGIDGNWTSQFVNVSPFGSWQWEGPIVMNVASAGVHTVGITQRESDTQVDKVVILKNGTVPTAEGPAESPRGP
jgi:hypothetical protein